MEYKTIVVKFVPGQKYNPPDAMLNEVAADGWELLSVAISANREIFYLSRKRVGPAQMPPAIPAEVE
jgi:hypothetical protein